MLHASDMTELAEVATPNEVWQDSEGCLLVYTGWDFPVMAFGAERPLLKRIDWPLTRLLMADSTIDPTRLGGGADPWFPIPKGA